MQRHSQPLAGRYQIRVFELLAQVQLAALLADFCQSANSRQTSRKGIECWISLGLNLIISGCRPWHPFRGGALYVYGKRTVGRPRVRDFVTAIRGVRVMALKNQKALACTRRRWFVIGRRPNQMVANPSKPISLSPDSPVFHEGYDGQAGPAYLPEGYPPMDGLQQYVEQAACQAYHQGGPHVSCDYSSATQFSGGGGYSAGPVVPQQGYQSDALWGGDINKHFVALGGKGVGLACDGRHNAFPHSVVLREDYDDGFSSISARARLSRTKTKLCSSMHLLGTNTPTWRIPTTSGSVP